VDVEAARRAYAELSGLAEALHLDGPIGLPMLIQVPGVLVSREADREADDGRATAVLDAVDAALADLVAMREVEGKALAEDMRGRVLALTGYLGQLTELAAAAPADAEARLRDRLSRLTASTRVAVDDARLAQEVALLADRTDVTEELVRIRSHLGQLDQLLAADHEVGRKLDFLVQEIGREINTVASKAQSA